jgi:hypothetical protein
MIIQFLPQAKSELLDAVEYYEGESNGLGYRFWEEVDQHIAWIAEHHGIRSRAVIPSYSKVPSNVRACIA